LRQYTCCLGTPGSAGFESVLQAALCAGYQLAVTSAGQQDQMRLAFLGMLGIASSKGTCREHAAGVTWQQQQQPDAHMQQELGTLFGGGGYPGCTQAVVAVVYTCSTLHIPGTLAKVDRHAGGADWYAMCGAWNTAQQAVKWCMLCLEGATLGLWARNGGQELRFQLH
jgi:hypothetical protein